MPPAIAARWRSPGILRARLRAAVDALDRHETVRAAADPLLRRLTRWTCRSLAADPRVRSVFARGSRARNSARLASDLDLAIVIREAGSIPDREAVLAVLRRLRRLRRLNPLLRDPWQMIVGDSEWPLVLRYWYLFQLDQWSGIDGRAPSFAATPIDERLLVAARWNRLHLWIDSALRHVIWPVAWSASAALAFAAAEKKALSFACAIEGTSPPDRRPPAPRSASEAMERAADLLGRFEDSARLTAERTGLDLDPPLPGLSDDARRARAPAPDAGTTSASVASNGYDLRALEAEPTAGRTLARAVLHSGVIAVVTAETPSADDRLALVQELARNARQTGNRFFVYSPLSLTLAPLFDELRVVEFGDAAGSGTLPDPLLLHEQLLYEAVFKGTELRVLAERPVGRGIPELTVRIARPLVYFETGRFVRSRDTVFRLACELVPGVARVVDHGDPDGAGCFRANALLFSRLVRRLSSLESG